MLNQPTDFLDLQLNEAPVERRRLQAGGIYCIACDDLAVLPLLGRAVLQPSTGAWRHAMVGPGPWLARISTESKLSSRQLRAYELTQATPAALNRLTADLDRALRPRHRLILLVLQAEQLLELKKPVAWLWHWHQWLHANGCILLMAVAQGAAPLIEQWARFNDVVSGLAEWRLDSGYLQHDIRYWRSMAGVVSPCSTRLRTDLPLLQAADDMRDAVSQDWDRNQVFLDQAVLARLRVSPEKDWEVHERLSSLLSRAMTAQAATVVFACNGNQDLAALARHLHSLRLQRGPNLKLVVCETGVSSLRNHDLNLLLACGATLLLPRQLMPAHVLHLLRLVKQVKYTRTLLPDLGSVLSWRWQARTQTLMKAGLFLDYLQQVVDQAHSGPSVGVLVAARPVSGINVEQVLSQIKLTRTGDAATALGGQVYLFLADGSLEMLQRTLGAVFRLDYRSMTTGFQAYAGQNQIGLQVQRMRQLPGQDTDWQAKCDRIVQERQAGDYKNQPYQPVLLPSLTISPREL